MTCGYGLSATFMLASKFAVVGTKAGTLQAFCIATGDMVQEIPAHGGAISTRRGRRAPQGGGVFSYFSELIVVLLQRIIVLVAYRNQIRGAFVNISVTNPLIQHID